MPGQAEETSTRLKPFHTIKLRSVQGQSTPIHANPPGLPSNSTPPHSLDEISELGSSGCGVGGVEPWRKKLWVTTLHKGSEPIASVILRRLSSLPTLLQMKSSKTVLARRDTFTSTFYSRRAVDK